MYQVHLLESDLVHPANPTRAFPVISNLKMNQCIKESCGPCGFNAPIHITGFRKGQRYDITESAKRGAISLMEKAFDAE